MLLQVLFPFKSLPLGLFHYCFLSLTGLTSIEKGSSFLLSSNYHPFPPCWAIALAVSLLSTSLKFQTFPGTPRVSYNSFYTQNPIQSSWISFLTSSPSTTALKLFCKICCKRQMYKSRVLALLRSPGLTLLMVQTSSHLRLCISRCNIILFKNHDHSLEPTTLN